MDTNPFLQKSPVELFRGEWATLLGVLEHHLALLSRDKYNTHSPFTEQVVSQQVELLEALKEKIQAQLLNE